MNRAIELTTDNIQMAYDKWFYTIVGAGGDLNDWMDGIQKALDKFKIGKVKQWYFTKGKVLNDKWNLTGTERFNDDLTFLMFDYEGMNVGKLAMFKIKAGDRWFTDIIDNSVRRCRPEQFKGEDE